MKLLSILRFNGFGKNPLQGNVVRKCVEKLDVLKVLNAKQKVPPSVVTTSTWETFEPSNSSATHWELFD